MAGGKASSGPFVVLISLKGVRAARPNILISHVSHKASNKDS